MNTWTVKLNDIMYLIKTIANKKPNNNFTTKLSFTIVKKSENEHDMNYGSQQLWTLLR